MVEIEFIYNQIKVLIQSDLNAQIKDIFQKYCIKVSKKLEDIFFLYNGDRINENLTLKEIYNLEDSSKRMQTLVFDINNEKESSENEGLKPSKYIICPKCNENIRISIKDYKIKLYDFRNNDIFDDILFNEFENTQMINEGKIICEHCKNFNKNDTYNNKFFRCFTCRNNICPLCKETHNKNHNIIDYEQKILFVILIMKVIFHIVKNVKKIYV